MGVIVTEENLIFLFNIFIICDNLHKKVFYFQHYNFNLVPKGEGAMLHQKKKIARKREVT